jgi:hypothetical protein
MWSSVCSDIKPRSLFKMTDDPGECFASILGLFFNPEDGGDMFFRNDS